MTYVCYGCGKTKDGKSKGKFINRKLRFLCEQCYRRGTLVKYITYGVI
jgi:hypothetical protein